MRMRHLILLCACALPAATTLAGSIIYSVDSARSSLSISGTFNGETLGSQMSRSIPSNQLIADGSIASYEGTITAKCDTLANTIQITGGAVDAQSEQSWSPSFVPANYGFSTSFNDGLSQPTNFISSIRNLSFSLVSSPIALTDGFSASQISAIITSGQMDYTLMQFFNTIPAESNGSIPFAGSLSLAQTPPTLANSTGLSTLTIPIAADFTTLVNNEPLILHFTGNIIATAATPEPITLALLLPAATLLLKRRHHI